MTRSVNGPPSSVRRGLCRLGFTAYRGRESRARAPGVGGDRREKAGSAD